MSTRHCATCRCSSTITGQIAMQLDSDPSRAMTCGQLAWVMQYAGTLVSLRSTLDRMTKEGKIRKEGRRYRSSLELPLLMSARGRR